MKSLFKLINTIKNKSQKCSNPNCTCQNCTCGDNCTCSNCL